MCGGVEGLWWGFDDRGAVVVVLEEVGGVGAGKTSSQYQKLLERASWMEEQTELGVGRAVAVLEEVGCCSCDCG